MRVVDVPGAIVMIPGAGFDAQHRKQRDHPGVPRDLDELRAELAARECVSAVFDAPREPGGDHSLLVHGATFKLRLFRRNDAAGRRDSYTVAAVLPLRLGDHHRLARGCLLVRGARWLVVPEPSAIPPGSADHWATLWAAWTHLTGVRVTTGAPALPGAQEAFLATVVKVAEAAKGIDTEGIDTEGLGTVAARTGPPEDPRLAAVLRRHQRQRAAIELLRARRARNTGLLAALADDTVRPLRPADADPGRPLDDDQLAAFRAALAVEDLMVVLGPPGTGKTTTIGRLVAAVAAAPARRVLVTAHTDHAVDDVLATLPHELLTFRIGGEPTGAGGSYLLERRATGLRHQALDGVRRTLEAYGGVERAAAGAVELDRAIERVVAVDAHRTRALAALAEVRRRVGGPAQAKVDGWTEEHDRCRTRLRAVDDKVARLIGRERRATARSGWPVLGGVFRVVARRAERGLARTDADRTRLRARAARAGTTLAAACRELDAVTGDVPAARAALSVVETVTRALAAATAAADTAASACRTALAAVATPPSAPEPTAWLDDLRRLVSWLRTVLPGLLDRVELLTEWRAEMSGEPRGLHAELVRYADVLAATCVAAGGPELAEVDFDLAVVDEAGRLGLADALVPLVRARRAVLVGDHRQPPPFPDTEVARWAPAEGDPDVRALLGTNVLALLVAKLPEDNVVRLTTQRRMPATIADFVSTAFYDGWLRTGVVRTHHDELFTAALAFVDTSALPTRAERRAGARGEDRGRVGYVNTAEADLLVELAAHYHRRRADWAVLVPYRAQADLLTRRLGPVVGSSGTVAANVGTVDSFQGGERDVILYGFTRSNPTGSVGCLDEPRRANLAFTRARRQLVLVGDLSTLTEADDPDFRGLARSLWTYAAKHGDVRTSRAVMARLREARR